MIRTTLIAFLCICLLTSKVSSQTLYDAQKITSYKALRSYTALVDTYDDSFKKVDGKGMYFTFHESSIDLRFKNGNDFTFRIESLEDLTAGKITAQTKNEYDVSTTIEIHLDLEGRLSHVNLYANMATYRGEYLIKVNKITKDEYEVIRLLLATQSTCASILSASGVTKEELIYVGLKYHDYASRAYLKIDLSLPKDINETIQTIRAMHEKVLSGKGQKPVLSIGLQMTNLLLRNEVIPYLYEN